MAPGLMEWSSEGRYGMYFPIDWMRRKMPKLGEGLCPSQQQRERASTAEGASRCLGDKKGHLRSGEGVWSHSDQAVAPTGRGCRASRGASGPAPDSQVW